MQFQVPQFLDVEDKIVGPLTAKQFIYVLGGAGGAYMIYRFVPTFLALIPAITFLGFALALAFYRFNGKPFVRLVESAFVYLSSSRMYVWHRREREIDPSDIELKLTRVSGGKGIPSAGGSKLGALGWEMDASQSVTDAEADDRA